MVVRRTTSAWAELFACRRHQPSTLLFTLRQVPACSCKYMKTVPEDIDRSGDPTLTLFRFVESDDFWLPDVERDLLRSQFSKLAELLPELKSHFTPKRTGQRDVCNSSSLLIA